MIIQGTTITTSRTGLGTHSLHRLVSSAPRRNLLALARDLGVRHFDTAPSYGHGLVEQEIGRFARTLRSELVLTTKFGIPTRRLGGLPGWNQIAMAGRLARRVCGGAGRSPGRDYSARQARESVENSLRALRTDYIDILFLHEPTLLSLGEPDALLRALETLKAVGKIRCFGLSGRHADCTEIAQKHPLLTEVLQIQAPAAPDGMPMHGYLQPPGSGISLWEFPPGSAPGPSGRLQQTLGQLQAAAAQSVTVVSTNSPALLREAVSILRKFEAGGGQSAKPSLAPGGVDGLF